MKKILTYLLLLSSLSVVGQAKKDTIISNNLYSIVFDGEAHGTKYSAFSSTIVPGSYQLIKENHYTPIKIRGYAVKEYYKTTYNKYQLIGTKEWWVTEYQTDNKGNVIYVKAYPFKYYKTEIIKGDIEDNVH